MTSTRRAPTTHDEDASTLGAIARLLNGSTDATTDAVGRERVLAAFAGRSHGRARVLVMAAAIAGIAAASLFVWHRPVPIDYRVAGPLVTEGDWLGVAPDRGPVSLRFSEGTEIELGPRSKGRVEDVTPEGARVVLGAGMLRARVVHREHTRWSVGAGPYSVEVTGTAFDVGWSPSEERFELSLHDGSVIVHGPSCRDGVRVAAGQRLLARARTGSIVLSSLFAAEPNLDRPAPAPSAEATAPAPPAPSIAPSRAAPSWSDLLASGNFRDVVAAAEAVGIEASLAHGSLADLAALSDAARYVHDRSLARRGLLAERSRFPRSAEARAAAFVLGRMADERGAKIEAMRWYETYLAESPRGAFAAEALGRKLVALVSLGRAAAASEAALEYLDRYPEGAHAAYARDHLHAP
jgi:TolA-binding protein